MFLIAIIKKEYNQSLDRSLIINNEYYISGEISINNIRKTANELDLLLKSNNYTFKYEVLSKLDELTRETIV